MRSYALPGTARDYDPQSNESLADFIKRQNLGSFTLGPFELNPLEFANVAATLASGGVWCPPNPIDKVFDRRGKDVAVTTETCEQVVPEGLANTLANAMSKDDQGSGTAAGSAGAAGWDLPMSGKTGTTEAHRSSAFLGFTNTLAGASYIYDDSTTPGDLCSFPLRQCGSGNLFGGNEPARTWFTAMKPIANNFGEVKLPPTDPRYVDGAPGSRVPSVAGMNQDTARQRLKEAGFQVADQATAVNSSASVRRCGRDLAEWSDGAWLDHHDPDLQRRPAATASAAARCDPGAAGAAAGDAAGDRPDGRRDPWAAADHRAGARSAATGAPTAAVSGL